MFETNAVYDAQEKSKLKFLQLLQRLSSGHLAPTSSSGRAARGGKMHRNNLHLESSYRKCTTSPQNLFSTAVGSRHLRGKTSVQKLKVTFYGADNEDLDSIEGCLESDRCQEYCSLERNTPARSPVRTGSPRAFESDGAVGQPSLCRVSVCDCMPAPPPTPPPVASLRSLSAGWTRARTISLCYLILFHFVTAL